MSVAMVERTVSLPSLASVTPKKVQDDMDRAWDARSGMNRRIEKIIMRRATRETKKRAKRRNRHKKANNKPSPVIVLKACAT